jgi:hypothetical protein
MVKPATPAKPKKTQLSKKATFGSLFKVSLEEYKSNFRTFLIFLLIFIGTPLVILTSIDIFSVLMNEETQSFLMTNSYESIPPVFIILMSFIAVIVYLFTYLFTTGAITYASIKNRGYNYNRLVKAGQVSWLKYFGFLIVFCFFLFLLFLLFIIPGIIFAVFWMLSIYVFFDEKKGIMNSLKKSKQLVKGNWWRTFGYALLLSLMLIVTQWIVSIPIAVISLGPTPFYLRSNPGVFIFLSVYSLFVNLFSALLYPIAIIFYKNYYFALKKEKGI